MRRPIEIVTKYLADSRDGLDRLIAKDTKGKKVIKIEKECAKGTFGRFVARVTTEEFSMWGAAT